MNGTNCGIGGIGINANASEDVQRAAHLFAICSISQHIQDDVLAGLGGTPTHKSVMDAAKLLAIDHLLHRCPYELSGVQKQRVAIGRAIVREPKLFLFDEPIAHLDAKLRAHMRGEIKHLQRSLGTTMIYVTLDQLEALSMADYIALVHDDELQQWGAPSQSSTIG